MKMYYIMLVLLLMGCEENSKDSVEKSEPIVPSINLNVHQKYQQLFATNSEFKVDGFDYPVGKPNAKGYYDAQPFGKNKHLGCDWNANTGGNSDLGHPIYATANGIIKSTEDIGGGWCKIIRMIHQLDDFKFVESFYAHCDTILVHENQWVKRGEQIGTIGNCKGRYYAHLHFEMRDSINMEIGGGYSENTNGYLNPTAFIKNNRPDGK